MLLENDTFNVLNPVMQEIKSSVNEMNVCFLLTHVPNPRINKRIEVFKNVANTKVICTRRSSQNIWEPSQDIEHFIFDIDLPSAKHIVKRCIVSKGFQQKTLNKLEEIKPNVIYAEGLDSLLIANIYRKKCQTKVFFEVADLRENYIVKPKKLVDRLITKTLLAKEKKLFKIVDYLIVTSPKFYDIHYKELISSDKMLYIPNAPDINVFKNYKKKGDGKFTVGFIGGIRYLKQMKNLVDAAGKLGINVLFAGAGGTTTEYAEIRKYCEGKKYVTFTGRYNYDSEIAELYGRVDCVYAVYDADNPNVRIALPNKLYESIICELPILVAKKTYLSELVEKWKVGVAVDHNILQELEDELTRLSEDKEYYQTFESNCRKLKESLINDGWKNEMNRFAES